jgi:spore maturation protein CgeB
MKESVPFDRMQEICKQVKFVLNVQPWLKSGTQERVFNAMLCGAIAVTDETDYLREQTVDERDLLLYNLDHLEQLPDKLRYYMEHEEEAQRIAASGKELALSKHTWEHRAQELLEYLNKGEAYADH